VDVAVRTPADYGLRLCTAGELAGADAAHNARALRAVLAGEDRGAHRDCLLLGTALALEVAGVVRDPLEGMARAAAAIDGGAARRVLAGLAALRPSATQAGGA
jgi:anthranilate phosphoribosyltransferase